jgi:hypothetical protein
LALTSLDETPLQGLYLTLYYVEALHPALQSNFRARTDVRANQ